jgi:hypothetical protein
MGYRKLTDAERAERRQADRDRLEQAARALLSSEGWRRWVKVRSTNGLSRYSFGNQLLIAMQRPDASYVAGFRAFLELNRCVRKGERAIRILAPMSLRDRESQKAGGETTAEDREQRRTVFRAVPVFDVSQTNPLPHVEPVLLAPPCQPIEGDSHAHLLEQLRGLAGELGYSVTPRPLDGSADGWCDSRKREIVINTELPGNAQLRVLVHEIAHALGVGYKDYGRERAEVLVDTVTYIVCGSVGLDVSGSSVPYVAGWGEGGELDAIRAYAQTIDEIARRIEGSIRWPIHMAGPEKRLRHERDPAIHACANRPGRGRFALRPFGKRGRAMADQRCGEWRAWLDRMPGNGATLHVTCTCSFPTTGYSVALERREPQGINERDLLLELHVHEPSGMVSEIVTEVDGRYSERTDTGYDTVSVVPEGPTAIPVEIVT